MIRSPANNFSSVWSRRYDTKISRNSRRRPWIDEGKAAAREPASGDCGWIARQRQYRSPPLARRRAAEMFRDDHVWIRFAARPTSGTQVPHDRDEFYIVASGTARYRWDSGETMIGPGDMMFAAAHTPHGYDQFSEDFSVWVVFYGPQKPAANR